MPLPRHYTACAFTCNESAQYRPHAMASNKASRERGVALSLYIMMALDRQVQPVVEGEPQATQLLKDMMAVCNADRPGMAVD